jgi:hypothetical protein
MRTIVGFRVVMPVGAVSVPFMFEEACLQNEELKIYCPCSFSSCRST